MTDIVKRLRDRDAVVLSGLFHAIPAMAAAADEIERLRRTVRLLGEIGEVCTFDDLNEICDFCRCGRASSPLSSKDSQ